MFEPLDKVFFWLIPRMPDYRWTARLMRLRYNLYARYFIWDKDQKQWVIGAEKVFEE
jgi:hypothetical protein